MPALPDLHRRAPAHRFAATWPARAIPIRAAYPTAREGSEPAGQIRRCLGHAREHMAQARTRALSELTI